MSTEPDSQVRLVRGRRKGTSAAVNMCSCGFSKGTNVGIISTNGEGCARRFLVARARDPLLHPDLNLPTFA